MIKRYSSPCARFTINVKKEGKSIPVVFDRYIQDEKRRFVEISDSAIQEQLEKSKDFNVYFRLDFSIPDPNEQREEANSPKEQAADLILMQFTATEEAKKFLNGKGVPYHKLTNKNNIIKQGVILGYEIEFQ